MMMGSCAWVWYFVSRGWVRLFVGMVWFGCLWVWRIEGLGGWRVFLFDSAADDVDLDVVGLGGELEGLATKRLDHALAQVDDPERVAVRHLELAHNRVVDLALVDGPEKGDRLGRGGQAQVDVKGVGLVAVDLDGDRVVHGVVDIGDREDDRTAVRDVVGVPCGKGGKEGEEGKRVRREEKKPRAQWFGYPPPRNFSTKSESIVVVTPMVAMEEAMDSNVNPS